MAHHFLLGPFLPGDSLRTTRGGSWVQGPRVPLTCGLGQVSAHPSYLLLTRSCDEGTIFVSNLQDNTKAQRGEVAHLKSHRSNRATGPEAQTLTPVGCLLLREALLDWSSPAPPPYPCQYKTETGFMAPGATHLLSHHRNWPPVTGQRPAGGAEAQTGKVTYQGGAPGVPLLSLRATVPQAPGWAEPPTF